jgi:hypothetical protein
MSRCDLSVHIDGGRVYAPGDAVSGTVEVRADQDCRCTALTISRLWKTHGRGSINEGGAEKQVAFSGTWSAGRSYTYPFTFAVPEGPTTYHGREVNVDWYVQAVADVPWDFDPRADIDFVVQVDPARRRAARPDGGEVVARSDAATGATTLKAGAWILGCLSAFMLPFVLVGAASLLSGIYALVTGRTPFSDNPAPTATALI